MNLGDLNCCVFFTFQVYFSANINSGIPKYEFSPAEKVIFDCINSKFLILEIA